MFIGWGLEVWRCRLGFWELMMDIFHNFWKKVFNWLVRKTPDIIIYDKSNLIAALISCFVFILADTFLEYKYLCHYTRTRLSSLCFFRAKSWCYLLCVCVEGVVEVLKGMQELGVSPDVETLSNYVLPVFPSMEASRQALKVIRKSACVLTCVQWALKSICWHEGDFVCSGYRCLSGVGGLLVFRGSLGSC